MQIMAGIVREGFNPCKIGIDHDHKWVMIKVDDDIDLSFSPAEAKAIAAALVHYAKRAQKIRDREDER